LFPITKKQNHIEKGLDSSVRMGSNENRKWKGNGHVIEVPNETDKKRLGYQRVAEIDRQQSESKRNWPKRKKKV